LQSSLIGKIEKARRYAQEPDRISFRDFAVSFHGEHDDYRVSYRNEKWECTCNFFGQWGLCSHTMALQRVLGEMLPMAARVSPTAPAPAASRLL
jgi:hypothetical protein